MEEQAKSFVIEKLIKLNDKYSDDDWELGMTISTKTWNNIKDVSYFKSRFEHNPNLTIEIIDKYSNKKRWEWWRISCNKNLSIELIDKYKDKPWDLKRMSENPSLTIEIINRYPERIWNWKKISHNPNISMKDIEKYPDKP